ncbi:UPF0545 protein C22orf39 homolog isoform X1 [Dama dama]|uniref:UPF0545 protein C22orf39 homolog isoform X1 n=1 Tax=Dama dama TaxID=30532 RepID=UPI002A36993A|nr:UPF0545 protein C22orf39 homolog isoform X1 [Dama dama]
MAEGEGWRPPRPCEAYRAEWELCRSAGHFLRHYYVHGERPACGQWRRDLASCREWEERRSAEAQADSLPPGPEGKPKVAWTGPNAMTGILMRNQGTEQPRRNTRRWPSACRGEQPWKAPALPTPGPGTSSPRTERNKCPPSQPLGLWCLFWCQPYSQPPCPTLSGLSQVRCQPSWRTHRLTSGSLSLTLCLAPQLKARAGPASPWGACPSPPLLRSLPLASAPSWSLEGSSQREGLPLPRPGKQRQPPHPWRVN